MGVRPRCAWGWRSSDCAHSCGHRCTHPSDMHRQHMHWCGITAWHQSCDTQKEQATARARQMLDAQRRSTPRDIHVKRHVQFVFCKASQTSSSTIADYAHASTPGPYEPALQKSGGRQRREASLTASPSLQTLLVQASSCSCAFTAEVQLAAYRDVRST